ncbi:LysR family transcriptional regulator [Methylobacterium sp.]|jgi:DNA-binding transcriptional LysR family regulator|uniref:LysR family transcriptional regulator n=1 Tax=Methylobacterium sp. TaxID=409 RepID=UPI002606B424|nr:LysR family transcriptional regulator [Methylobacterium sp.]MDB5648177.1 LysR family transcriptional regulator [Methylobacterium sp.]
MDSAWLEDFLALVDGGHFSRAAEQRGITQPAFSRRVRALEEWVGSPLFDRDGQPVTLTAAGVRFRPVAEETLRRLYQGREAAREAGRHAAETLRFAATQALSLTFFPPWLRALEAREPLSATIHLTAAHMAACEGVMLRGEAQFLLCHHHPAATTFMTSDQFRGICVGTDRLLAVSAPEPGGAGPLFRLSGPSEAPIPLLAFSGESGLGRILAATRALEESEARLIPSFTSHLASVLVAMARDGRGLAFAPMSLVADDLARGTLVRAGQPERDIAIEIRLYRARARQSPPAERLWAAVAGGVRPDPGDD